MGPGIPENDKHPYFFTGFTPSEHRILQTGSVRMEAKKRPISTTLACSLVVFSFTLCFVTLIHVEIELHAHRNMLQVLTQQREESIHSRRTVNDKLIASALRSDNGKGQCFFLLFPDFWQN